MIPLRLPAYARHINIHDNIWPGHSCANPYREGRLVWIQWLFEKVWEKRARAADSLKVGIVELSLQACWKLDSLAINQKSGTIFWFVVSPHSFNKLWSLNLNWLPSQPVLGLCCGERAQGYRVSPFKSSRKGLNAKLRSNSSQAKINKTLMVDSRLYTNI